MKRLAAIAVLLALVFPAAAIEYKTVDIRRTGNSPVRETFWAGDSIAFGYSLEEDSSSYDLTPWDMVTWEICTYTNPAQCWMAVTGSVDDAESGELSVETMLPLSVVPEGQYRGYVKGLKVTASNTVASQRVLVEQVVTVRYGQTEFPPDAEDNADIIAGNAYARISDVEAEAAERQHADNILSNAIAVISTQGGGEPIWKVGYLPAKEDEREDGDTNVTYTVEYPVTFLEPLRALDYGFWDEGDELPIIETPSDTVTNNGLTRYNTRNRSFGKGIVLNSSEGSFLRMSLGDYAGLRMSRRTGTKAKATLSAEGEVEVQGEQVTIKAEVYDEDEDETVPGPIAMEGNTSVNGALDVDGDADVHGDMEADSFTLNGVTIDEWPTGDEEAIAELRGSVATNAAEIADLHTTAGNLQSAVNAAASGVSSNATRIERVNTRIDTRIDGLYGVCRGGFRWPDYFRVVDYATGVKSAQTTNEYPVYATNTAYNIVETLETNLTMLGWQVRPEIIRMAREGDAIAWEPIQGRRGNRDKTGRPVVDFSMNPDLLETHGNQVYFKEGVTEEDVDGGFATVKGTLGNYTQEVNLDFDAEKQATNRIVSRFVSPVPGSLLEACYSNILVTASNAYAQGKGMGLRTWPQGYGGRTNHVEAGWNTNFWAYGLGDFSCISYHTEGPPAKPGDGAAYGVYMPVTMVTPRHGIVANHWKPIKGSNVYWVSRSGAILTNRVIAYKNIRSDLTVARLDHAFDPIDIAPATLLAEDFNSYTYGSTYKPLGTFGIPVLSFDCAERGWVSGWSPPSFGRGRDGTDYHESKYTGSYYATGADVFGNGRYEGPYRGNGGAVGGDSGSPTFLLIDGKTILIGCFYTAPGGGPMPHKAEVDEVIEAWGDSERCEEYSLGAGHWPTPDVPPAPH